MTADHAAAIRERSKRLDWLRQKYVDDPETVAELAALLAELEAARETCPFCGHLWRQHDPVDGECDSHTSELHRFGVCQCGRDLAWTQEKITKLSRVALTRAADARAALAAGGET